MDVFHSNADVKSFVKFTEKRLVLESLLTEEVDDDLDVGVLNMLIV